MSSYIRRDRIQQTAVGTRFQLIYFSQIIKN